MATATATRKASRNASTGVNLDNVNGAHSPETLNIVVTPNMQEAVSSPVPTAPDVRLAPDTAPDDSMTFDTFTTRLSSLIHGQRNAILGYYIDRGDIVRAGINFKLAKSIDKKTRAANRDSAVKSLTATAEGAIDPSTEPAPKLQRWITLSVLAEFFPAARNLSSVRVAEALAGCLTRVDPPKTWNAPDVYELKPRFDWAEVANLIDRAIVENMTSERAEAALEAIGGRVMADPEMPTMDDSTANADAMATRVMTSIVEGKIDPARFVATLQLKLSGYGWAIAPGRDDKGKEVFKLVKNGR